MITKIYFALVGFVILTGLKITNPAQPQYIKNFYYNTHWLIMTVANDIFTLEEINALNVIDTRWFLPFTIYRLQPLAVHRSVTFEVTLQNIMQKPLEVRRLHLTWTAGSEKLITAPVQEHVITEWAACGIACAVVPLYTGFQVLQVTQVRDGFDYWIGNDLQEFGLEISGMATGDFDQRHRSKVRQFLSSTHKVAGYVSVTNFQTKQTILSFHQHL